MTTVGKATAETEAVLKEDSSEEIDTDDGSGETKEVDLRAVAKEKQKQFVQKRINRGV